MKPVSNRSTDPERQRCTGCGHPRREHRQVGCTVPRCACETHVEPGRPEAGRTGS